MISLGLAQKAARSRRQTRATLNVLLGNSLLEFREAPMSGIIAVTRARRKPGSKPELHRGKRG